MSEEALARKIEIEAEVEQLEALAREAGDYSEEQSERLEALEIELDELADTGTIITDEQRAAAIAYVVIGDDGEPRLHHQLYVEPAAEEALDEDIDADPDDLGDEATAEPEPAKDEVKYSAKLSDELAMMKTELLAVHIASDAHFALDLGTFIMADNATRTMSYYGMPSELRANAPSPRVANFASGMAAAESWAKLEAELDRSWINHKEMEQRYDAFCALDDAARAAWLGWAVARTLHAVPDGATGASFLNHLGAKLGIDVAAWWRPTARNFFDRIAKSAILKLFEAIGGNELASRYTAARKFDLAASAEKLFAGQIIVDNEVKDRALAWLPGAMRFMPEADQVELDVVDELSGTDEVTTDGEDGAPASSDQEVDALREAA